VGIAAAGGAAGRRAAGADRRPAWLATAEILVRTLQPVQSGHGAAFLTVVLGVPLIVAMIFIVAAEALSLLQLIGYNLLVVGGILALRALYVIFRGR
jgi:hypothetical protein